MNEEDNNAVARVWSLCLMSTVCSLRGPGCQSALLLQRLVAVFFNLTAEQNRHP